MKWYNTLTPYRVVDYEGIQYTVCRKFDHISRYKNLRQVVHMYNRPDRFISLETPNPFETEVDISYYEVPAYEENRLDLISYKFLGSANYSWIIAYINGIEDGFTVKEGQTIKIPKSISALFNNAETLQSISPIMLNLGSE